MKQRAYSTHRSRREEEASGRSARCSVQGKAKERPTTSSPSGENPPSAAKAVPEQELSFRLKRLVKTPKLHLGDTGLACGLLGLDAKRLWEDRTALGPLLETFVYQELRRHASWQEDHIGFHHFRDKDMAEVDIVLERGAGQVAGVEVKAAATVTAADFRGLKKLKEASGKRLAGGVVVYDGETSASFGYDLYAVPIRTLWGGT